MNTEKDFASLSASYLAGEMSKKETSYFLKSMKNDEEKKKEFLLMQATWERVSSDPVNDYTETVSAWNKLYERMDEEGLVSEEQSKSRILSSPFMRIAAAILLFLAILTPTWLYLRSDRLTNDDGLNYLAIDNNAAYDLPDGSRVFLKKGSLIELSASFETRRSVNLRGEAYFDIMEDPSRPFIISTGTAEVKVLGTSFNVKEDPATNTTGVFVESGKVQVKALREEKELILTNGQYSEIDRHSAKLVNLSDPNYLAWKTREFHFQNENILDVFQTLEDAYQVKIITKDRGIDDLRLTSSYHKQSIDAILETIALAFDLDIEKKKEKYLVRVEK